MSCGRPFCFLLPTYVLTLLAMTTSAVGHFFGAIRVDAFRPLDEFKANMDDIIRRLKGSAKAAGAERIYIHGEKEFEEEKRRRREGIPLHPKTVAAMQQIARELGVEYDLE